MQTRAILRGVVLTIALGALGLLAVAVVRQRLPGSPTGDVADFDQWAARGVDYTHQIGDSSVLRIRAAEARVDRVRVGVFRVGFALALFMRDADVAIALGTAREDAADEADEGGRGSPEIAGSASGISSVSIDGVRLRVTNTGGRWLELSAGRCDAGWQGQGRVVFRKDVRVKTAQAEHVFRRLEYDVRRQRFVAAEPAGDGGEALIEQVNLALWNVGPIDTDDLRPGLAGLLGPR